MNRFRLDGKTALITGASSGLGAHFARTLSAQGARVLLAARREHLLAEQVETIRRQGGQADALSLDVRDAASVEQAFTRIRNELGDIDVLINNAGVATEPKRCLEVSEEDWHFQMDTNLTGAWRVAQSAAQQWVAATRPGVIVNIASIYGVHTGAQKVAYNVSKAGVVQLTRTMAVELVRHGIRVNALCPGWFRTAINQDFFATESGERYARSIPMRRLGRLEELDGPLLLLASDASAYMTGTEIIVDGGITQTPI